MNSGEELRLLLRIHYQGSDFLGWQFQPEGRTVQGTLEAAIERLMGVPHRVVGAGRTDRGVHATGQVAAVTVPSRWTPREFRRAMNAVLPADVWIESSTAVAHDFHPRYQAVARTYHYRLGTSPATSSPFHRRTCWALGMPLDPGLLDRAASPLVGTHSFRAFAKAGQEHLGENAIVTAAGWDVWADLGLQFTVTANRFLHRMVRYLVGTMVDIARGRRPESDVVSLLEGDTPGLITSPPAPPEGLFLAHVAYADESLVSPPQPEPAEASAGTTPGDQSQP